MAKGIPKIGGPVMRLPKLDDVVTAIIEDVKAQPTLPDMPAPGDDKALALELLEEINVSGVYLSKADRNRAVTTRPYRKGQLIAANAGKSIRVFWVDNAQNKREVYQLFHETANPKSMVLNAEQVKLARDVKNLERMLGW